MANVKINTTNTAGGYAQPVNPNTTGVVASGFYPQNATSNDADAGVERGATGSLELKAGDATRIYINTTGGVSIDAPTADQYALAISSAGGLSPTLYVEGNINNASGSLSTYGAYLQRSGTAADAAVSMTRDSSDNMLLATASTTRVTVGATGEVAIAGTAVVSSNTSGAALRVTQTGSGEAIRVEDSSNPDSTPFVVAADGSVGIGTATPGQKLTVAGTVEIAQTNTQEYRFNGGSGRQWRAISTINGSTNGNLVFQNTTDNYVANFTDALTLTSGGNVGVGTSPTSKLHVDGTITIGTTTSTYQAGALGYTDANWGFIYRPPRAGTLGAHNFEAYDGTDLMTVTDGGNVGIGTASPGQKLTVDGGTTEIRSGNYLMLRPTSNTWDFRIKAVTATTEKLNIYSGGDLVNPIATFVDGGKVGIGTSSPAELLHVSGGNIRNSALAGSGNRAVYSTGDGNLTNDSSDATLKTNIADLADALTRALALRPVTFNWLDTDKRGTQQEVGFIAQEVRPVIPEVIGANADGTLTVDYPKLTAVLAGALKALHDKCAALEQRVETLETKA